MRFAVVVLAALLGGAALAEGLPPTGGEAAGRWADTFLNGKIGGDFDLVDQTGQRRRLADFAGRHILLFFGYANCEQICSAAIPLMSAALDELGPDHKPLDLVMVTVDPERDTPQGMRTALAKFDARLIALTGTRAELAPVWSAFNVRTTEVARDLEDKPIYAHDSFIFLLGPDGKVLSLLPPMLPPSQIAKILRARF
ncbi:MAG: SCO family protein [Methylobacteriaceae bacterium]|nr:SCO family protein [Methylobacteriaceae bacterium]